MFQLSQSLELDQPAAVVWSYLVAFEQVPLWEHGILEVRQVTPGPPAVGTAITARRVYAGRATELRGEISAFQDGRSCTMVLQGGPLVATSVTYAVEPLAEGRSRTTYSASGRMRGALRLVEPILPAIGRAEARKNLASLGRRIAAGIPPRSNIATPPPS